MLTTDPPMLRTETLSVTYGGLTAVNQVSLEIRQGTLVGLIGPNGAGKTSLIDVLSGFTPASSGRILFDGNDITRMRPHTRARRGLARTFQSLELFNDLTVAENVQVTTDNTDWRTAVASLMGRHGAGHPDIEAVLDSFELGHLAGRLPTELSHGQRKLVGIARAVAARPKLLLLDEPAAGLDTPESRELGKRLRSMVDSGSTMLLIDHDMGLVLNVCDIIYVLEFGTVIARGAPAEIRRDPAVIAAYLGSSERPSTQPSHTAQVSQ